MLLGSTHLLGIKIHQTQNKFCKGKKEERLKKTWEWKKTWSVDCGTFVQTKGKEKKEKKKSRHDSETLSLNK